MRTTGAIVPDHSDFSRPEFGELLRQIQERAGLFDTSTQTWIHADPAGDPERLIDGEG